MADKTPLPRALPLVFTPMTLYKDEVSCIFNNDSFTEYLNEDYDSYVMNPWAWKHADSTNTIALFVPTIAAVTIVMNVIAVVTFVKENMMSPMNVILVAMAVSDSLTVSVPSFAILSLYGDGVFPDFIPFKYCSVWGYLTKYLPTITHNASVWLTLVLAAERYLVVCKPFLARRYCTHKNSLKAILCIYVFAVLSHICRFVDTEYVPVKIVSVNMADNQTGQTSAEESSPLNVNINSGALLLNGSRNDMCNSLQGIQTCRAVYSDWLNGYGKEYEFFYYWFVILFVKFIPCSCLIVFDSLLIQQLKNSASFRLNIALHCNKHMKDMKVKLKESRRITVMIIAIIVLVVIVELPLGIILVLWTLSALHGHPMIDEHTLSRISRISNAVIYVSYPAIFMTYCCMSVRFRLAVRKLFSCNKLPKGLSKVSTCSSASGVSDSDSFDELS